MDFSKAIIEAQQTKSKAVSDIKWRIIRANRRKNMHWATAFRSRRLINRVHKLMRPPV